jgi:uncharacterized membrane protein
MKLALLKRVIYFLIIFGVISLMLAKAIPATEQGQLGYFWLGAMVTLAPFGVPVLLVIVFWTVVGYGRAQVQTEEMGSSEIGIEGPKFTPGGNPIISGIDPQGNTFGTSND